MDIQLLRQTFRLNRETGELFWRPEALGPAYRVNPMVPAGHVTSDGYRRLLFRGKKLLAHRVVFAMETGECPQMVDHVNGNKLDNRPCNLRAATRDQNQQNRRRNANNKSGVKGVHWRADSRKWAASIQAEGKHIHLGLFSLLSEAEAAVIAARSLHHGQFAKLG